MHLSGVVQVTAKTALRHCRSAVALRCVALRCIFCELCRVLEPPNPKPKPNHFITMRAEPMVGHFVCSYPCRCSFSWRNKKKKRLRDSEGVQSPAEGPKSGYAEVDGLVSNDAVCRVKDIFVELRGECSLSTGIKKNNRLPSRVCMYVCMYRSGDLGKVLPRR